MSVAVFTENASTQPVRYVEGTGGDFGAEPVAGSWQPIAGRPAIPVVAMDIPTTEKVRAGIEATTPAKTLYFNLVNGKTPLTERDTVDVGGTRFNVLSVVAYDVAGFDRVGYAEVVKL